MWLEVQGAKTTAEKIFGILNRADDSESDNHSISQVEELEISHLSKSYNGREILRDLNLAIRQGEKSSSKGQVAVGNQPSSEWSQEKKSRMPERLLVVQGMVLKQVTLFVR